VKNPRGAKSCVIKQPGAFPVLVFCFFERAVVLFCVAVHLARSGAPMLEQMKTAFAQR